MSTELTLVVLGQAANLLLVAFFAGRVTEAVSGLKNRLDTLESRVNQHMIRRSGD